MHSETVNELVATLSELESRLQQFDTEARRLGELRIDLKGATVGLQFAGKELQTVASALHDSAATMRELDMAATLRRIAEIEAVLDARSEQLAAVIDREIAELGESVRHQLSKQIDALPIQLGNTVAAAFDKQFKATKTAIDSLVANAGAWHAKVLTTIAQALQQEAAETKARDESINQAIIQLSADMRAAIDALVANAGAWQTQILATTAQALQEEGAESKARHESINQAVIQLCAAVREATDRQTGTLVNSLSDADARSAAHSKEVASAVHAGAQRTARLALLAVFFGAAALVAAMVSIFF